MNSCRKSTSSPSRVVATSSAFLTSVVCSDPPWQFCKTPRAKSDEPSAWNLDGNKLTSEPLSRITHSPSPESFEICVQSVPPWLDSPCGDIPLPNDRIHSSWSTGHMPLLNDLLSCPWYFLCLFFPFWFTFWFAFSFSFVLSSTSTSTAKGPWVHPFTSRESFAFVLAFALSFSTFLYPVNLHRCRTISKSSRVTWMLLDVFEHLLSGHYFGNPLSRISWYVLSSLIDSWSCSLTLGWQHRMRVADLSSKGYVLPLASSYCMTSCPNANMDSSALLSLPNTG